MVKRNGQRKPRSQRVGQRIPALGYYMLVTDTNETEKNYFFGLKKSIPEPQRQKIVIKVTKTRTHDLVKYAKELASQSPQYCETWIIFDRDLVDNFDQLIHDAHTFGLRVGWSNPCIEVWFHAYLGKMPVNVSSVACCKNFEQAYQKATGKIYRKSMKDIYQQLNKYGNENCAISLAKCKIIEHNKKCNDIPSQMCPCTTLYELIEEIRTKVNGMNR